MKIEFITDYNSEFRKGSKTSDLPEDLKAKLVKVGLAREVKALKAPENKSEE